MKTAIRRILGDAYLARVGGDGRSRILAQKRARSRASFADFVSDFWSVLEPARPLTLGWALGAMLEHLEAVARREIRRLLINIYPGGTKSLATSVFLPGYIWGPLERPTERIIGTSYDGQLAIRDSVRCRDLVSSEEYCECWPHAFEFKDDQNAKGRFENVRGGWRQAASVGSALTGHRGDLIIVDDPHSTKSGDSEMRRREALRWFGETLPTRFNDQSTGALIVIMQRLHVNDVSGHILKHELGYEHLCIPMEYEPDHPFRSTRWTDPRTTPGELADPVRFPREAVEELKRNFRAEGGSYAEAGQLQQRPIPRGGGLFKEDWFKFRDAAPEQREIAHGPIRGWDLAGTDDEHAAYTAGVKGCRLRTGETVILDVRCEQLEPALVYAMIRRTAESDGRGVTQSLPQDPGQAGKDQKRHIASELAGFTVHFSPESGSKEMRAAPLASQAEAGNLVLVRAPWNDAFIAEAIEFPRGTWKDKIDAASRMFAKLTASSTPRIPAAPKAFPR